MRCRGAMRLLTGLSFVVCSACSADEAAESTQMTETTPPSPFVTAEDIPDDITEDSWARLPLPRRDELGPDGAR